MLAVEDVVVTHLRLATYYAFDYVGNFKK